LRPSSLFFGVFAAIRRDVVCPTFNILFERLEGEQICSDWFPRSMTSSTITALRDGIMNDLHTRIVELESKAADCELLSSLAADSKVRAENRKRVAELQEQAWALREANSLRLTA
jgi:hypothetical protein